MVERKPRVEVEVEGRPLTLSNLSKVLYPEAGFTKAQVIDYYRRIAPVLVPHLTDRPLTLKRYPNGVDSMFFFEKNATKGRPEWVKTVGIWGHGRGSELHFMLCNDTPTLVYIANLAGLELHPALACAPGLESPTMVVFDLDPGPPADLVTCCNAALVFREYFRAVGLESVAKTSGNKGMQLYVPLNTPITYDETKSWARGLAEVFEAKFPELFVSQMKKSLRDGKVFVDWSQNDANKTTISVYSLRARARPTVSTPISWEEIEVAVKKADASHLVFEAGDVLTRVETVGDLFAPALSLKQQLPDSPRAGTRKRAARARGA
ncbi:MAG: non-homologous end-joining DNA ligase [Archangium sp.]|nr:non-homologous end-joining DNA ligase [Archangium sp.]MDP3156538.1 non-homologous end-joining DNA ligase [Archangium sp.]MDP3573881.1 non-homologous end-joining DNA ligase [Archangium sp.]